MDWVVYLFGSGAAFFAGVGLVLLAVVLFATRRAGLKVVATLTSFVGLIFIAASSTPLPYWLYGLGSVITATWLLAERTQIIRLQTRPEGLRWGVAVIWLAAVAVEAPYHLAPHVM